MTADSERSPDRVIKGWRRGGEGGLTREMEVGVLYISRLTGVR